jgi:ferredoxin
VLSLDRVRGPGDGSIIHNGGQHVKIVVDFDKCKSNALCMAEAPEVFEVRDDNFLYILNENSGEELRPQVEEAARVCPTRAISIRD